MHVGLTTYLLLRAHNGLGSVVEWRIFDLVMVCIALSFFETQLSDRLLCIRDILESVVRLVRLYCGQLMDKVTIQSLTSLSGEARWISYPSSTVGSGLEDVVAASWQIGVLLTLLVGTRVSSTSK